MSYNYFKWLCYFVITVVSLNALQCQNQTDTDGDVLLQDTIITNDTRIHLKSGWAFYWKSFILPGEFEAEQPSKKVSLESWTNYTIDDHALPSFGYATYRMQIDISKNRPASALYIPRIYAASKLWINGRFISETGRIGTSKSEVLHRRFTQIIPLNTNETHFDIVIHVSNFYHSKAGIAEPLVIGSSHSLNVSKVKTVIADMIFIGCLGFIGLFFIIFYTFYWNKDQAVLYFGVLCISLSYMALSDRYAPLTEIFPEMNWIMLTRLEYLSLFLSGTTASLFFSEIFINFVKKGYRKLTIIISLSLAIVVLVLPAPYFTKLILPFFIVMIFNILYVIYVIVKGAVDKRYESLLLLLSMMFGASIFCIHIFFFLGRFDSAIIYINFGYVVTFLMLSMLLMTRFSGSFKELERSKAFALKQKNQITLKSDQLAVMNVKLQENLKLLEDSNAELEDFNHIVSHDLKTPLVSVYSLVSFIEEDLKDSLHKDTQQHLTLLKGVVSKMEALINGLLHYSRIAKGNKRQEEFKINSLLTKVVDVVDYKNLSKINLPENNITLCANKVELEHVFQNLLSNAIKHNDKEQAVIDISLEKHPDYYMFTIRDNGPGIAPEHHTKIFKIFSQLHVNPDVEGTGIGLAIVKKIISENHGDITVDSEKGKGLTISFTWRVKGKP